MSTTVITKGSQISDTDRQLHSISYNTQVKNSPLILSNSKNAVISDTKRYVVQGEILPILIRINIPYLATTIDKVWAQMDDNTLSTVVTEVKNNSVIQIAFVPSKTALFSTGNHSCRVWVKYAGMSSVVYTIPVYVYTSYDPDIQTDKVWDTATLREERASLKNLATYNQATLDIVDGYNSTKSDKALSANMGRDLNERIIDLNIKLPGTLTNSEIQKILNS